MISLKLAFLVLVALAAPVVGALPGVCGAECTITAASIGYDPIVAIVPSGSTVSWFSEDTTHVTRDQAVSTASQPCFNVLAEQGATTPGVRFDIVGGALFATTEGETLACTNAVGAAAAFVVPYFCTIHPTMRAALVVTT